MTTWSKTELKWRGRLSVYTRGYPAPHRGLAGGWDDGPGLGLVLQLPDERAGQEVRAHVKVLDVHRVVGAHHLQPVQARHRQRLQVRPQVALGPRTGGHCDISARLLSKGAWPRRRFYDLRFKNESFTVGVDAQVAWSLLRRSELLL